jgi:hypothetical protein
MSHANFEQKHATEDPEIFIIGGVKCRRISNEEGEASMAQLAATLLGEPLNLPEGTDPSEPEVIPLTTSPSAATKLSGTATPPLLPVPSGLARCPVCNEYRGTIDLDDESPHSRRPGDFTTVQCICDGIICPCCNINRIHRPISNVWDERGGFGHIPYFAAMGPCNECRDKREAEDADRKRKTRSRSNDEEPTMEGSK